MASSVMQYHGKAQQALRHFYPYTASIPGFHIFVDTYRFVIASVTGNIELQLIGIICTGRARAPFYSGAVTGMLLLCAPYDGSRYLPASIVRSAPIIDAGNKQRPQCPGNSELYGSP